MSQTDPDYFAYRTRLSDVAQADVEFIRVKDRSYGGSWKKSGGRSAWHMVRRKMDRLLEMMAPPQDTFGLSLPDLDDAIASNPDEVTLATEVVKFLRDSHLSEDVFAKIAEDPSGDDGTVLAEIRDLRRYLLLVEADVVARGVVKTPSWFEEEVPPAPKHYQTPPIMASVEVCEYAKPDQSQPLTPVHGLRVKIVAVTGDTPPVGVYEYVKPGTPEDGGHHAHDPDEDADF